MIFVQRSCIKDAQVIDIFIWLFLYFFGNFIHFSSLVKVSCGVVTVVVCVVGRVRIKTSSVEVGVWVVVVDVGVWVAVDVLGVGFGITFAKMMVERSGVWVSVKASIVGVVHSVGVEHSIGIVLVVTINRWVVVVVEILRIGFSLTFAKIMVGVWVIPGINAGVMGVWGGIRGCIWGVPLQGVFIGLGGKVLELCSLH